MTASMKKPGAILRTLLAAATVVVVISGCGASHTKTASTVASANTANATVIDFVCATPTTASFFAPIEQGAKDAAAQLGVKLRYTGLGATVSPAAMAQVLTPAVDQHPAALAVCNFFPTAEDSIIRSAVSQHIPVVVTNSVSDAAKDGAVGIVGQDDFDAGQAAGKAMIQAGVKQPLCVNQVPDNPSVTARCDGFAAAFKAAGEQVKVLDLPTTQYNDQSAQCTAIQGSLSSDHHIDGILTLAPTLGPCAAQDAAMVGLQGVKVGTFDISSDVVDNIINGKLLFAVWQQPYLEGYEAVVSAVLHARHGFGPVGTIATGPELVTKANVATVKMALASGIA